MRNFKLVMGFSAFGFLLSLISGFVSHSKVGAVFLHALVFAIVFALLGFLLEFIFEHVLEVDFSSDSPTMEGALQNASSRQGTGHKVDFYVEDEPLPSDNGSPQFFVSSPRNIFSDMDEKAASGGKNFKAGNTLAAPEDAAKSSGNETPIASHAVSSETVVSNAEKAQETHDASPSARAQNAPSQGFVPISLGETPSTTARAEEKKTDGFKPSNEMQATPPKKAASDDDELDELPDMESIGEGNPSYGSGGLVSEAEEDDAGYVSTPSRSSGNDEINEFASGQDTQLMAKAISTLLASE